MKRYLTLLLSAVLILSLFTACGSSSSGYEEGAMAEDYAPENMDTPMMEDSAANAAAGKNQLPENRKWVITAEVQAETDQLDSTMDAVFARVAELEGYVEDQHFDSGTYYGGNDHSRSARMVVRVPADRVDEFMDAVKEQTNVVSSSKNLEDITLQYTDTETRIKALKSEEERLLAFMEQADSMADLLEIERRLTDVHYELENVSSRLRTYDNQVNYATIRLTIDEVQKYTPVEEPTFLERITVGFVESVHGVWKGLVDLTVEIIVASPYLVVWGTIILVIVLIVKACSKKNLQKKQKQQTASAAPGAPQAQKPQKPQKEIPAEWKNFDQASKEASKKDSKP